MDEDEFRRSYHSLVETRCVFEKSILTRNCDCRFQQRVNLAEREGVKCCNSDAQTDCSTFLSHCRQKARFALRLTHIVGNLLPHSKEVQVQKGALLGLTPDLANRAESRVEDIRKLIEQALDESDGDLTVFPYQRLIPSISAHPPLVRKRRRKP